MTRMFLGAPYEALNGPYVAAKKDLKTLGERLNFLSAWVNETANEIDNVNV